MKHLLTLSDLSPAELRYLIDLTEYFKKKRLIGEKSEDILRGKTLGLVFQKPSTRTRVSLEVAILELGGRSIYMDWRTLQLARGEPIKDTARVLSRYLDGIIARVYEHETLVEMAKYSRVPIINALSNMYHPMQAISDMFTLREHFGTLNKLKVTFVGDGGSNVCHSLLLACTMLGVSISIASPPQYRPHEKVLEKALKYAEKSGSKVEVTDDPVKAVEGADAVYTDVFVSMGFEAEREERLKVFIPKYRITVKLMKKAKPDAVFMHCLPAKRGEEVEEEVLEDEKISIVWTQAENRLHSAKAILSYIYGGRYL